MAGNRLGAPRRHFTRIDSTNRVARELAQSGAAHGTLVTAREQSSGRGRQGRAWAAPAGTSLLMSLVIRDPGRLLSLAAGVAVAQTADAVTGGSPAAMIKWPNDVLVAGRKVAGILVEGRPQENWAVLGIGVNVAVDPAQLPAELAARAGTFALSPQEVDRVLHDLIGRLEKMIEAPDSEILAAIEARDRLRGRELSWRTPTGVRSGIACGIDAGGGLRVQPPEGSMIVLEAGEVHIGSLGSEPC